VLVPTEGEEASGRIFIAGVDIVKIPEVKKEIQELFEPPYGRSG